MNDGKLVRDLIPDVIRAAGGQPEVRHVSGDELLRAISAKLMEEAQEVVKAADNRAELVEELADVSEVMAALMKLRGIGKDEVARAAEAKRAKRGGFEAGVWLVDPVPSVLRGYTTKNVDDQRVQWRPERWRNAFVRHETALTALEEHSRESGGIARSFVHAQADGDPVDLFLMAMVWGYGTQGLGPGRTAAIMEQPGAADAIRAIVKATRDEGAAAGWHALLNTHRVKGLGMSFGTKLLYFAGYNTSHRPRPLILDERVRASLQRVAPGTVSGEGWVQQVDYVRYLELAEKWSAEPSWLQGSDVVEFALFDI